MLSFIDGRTAVLEIPIWLNTLHHSQRKRIGFFDTIPDESTFRRVLRKLDVEKLNTALSAWFLDVGLNGIAISVDGKRLCGAHNSDEKPPEILNIVAHQTGEVLGQEPIAGTGREREAAVKWISKTSLLGCLVTADALHTNREMAELITSQCKGNYLFSIKGNNKFLFNEMSSLKMHERRGNPHASTFEKGHGREESREIWATTNLGSCGKVSNYFPGAEQVATLVRTQKNLKSGKETKEVAYLVTSCTRIELNPREILEANRGHWTVEAKNHYPKDGYFAEDKSRARAGHLALNLSILRNAALKILRKIQIALCHRKGRNTIPEAARKLKKEGGVCKLLGL